MAEKEAVSYIVGSKVKEYWAKKDLRCAGETLDALSLKVEKLMEDAAARTKGNGRQTVKPDDL
jgi:histone H3/H4